MKQKAYGTYLIFNDKHASLIKHIIQNSNSYYFGFRDDPSNMNWIHKKSNGETLFQRKPNKEEIGEMLNDYERAKELLIYTNNEDTAQNISNLIHGGNLLAYPSIFENPRLPSVYDIDYEVIIDNHYKKDDIIRNIIFPCLVAKKSWNNRTLIYCIEKYSFSLNLDSFTPHSASPSYGQVFSIDNDLYSYHVKAAYAFLSAYSIIEELELEIRSSASNPRFINNEWNPKVKQDILNRLKKINICENETVPWIIRGEPSEIYKEIKPALGKESKWNDRKVINDKEMKIYDALHYCSYIRNFFIAHKFNDIVSKLNPYDVHNVQVLVRRLILGRLELWNYKEDDPGKYII